MKSLKDYALNLTEQEYHDRPSWSYSLIARYAREGFSILPILHERVTPNAAMEFGSLFDTMITRPNDVIKEYAISDMVAPNAEKGVFDILLRNGAKVPFANLDDADIKEAINEAGYQSRWSYETQYKHLSEYSEYYDIRRTGRKVVSSLDFKDAMQMKMNFYANPLVASLFGNGDNYLYQVQFEKEFIIPDYETNNWEIMTPVNVKAMFDLIKVDHENKTLQPIDLKTSSFPGYEFANNFVKMRYDLQAQVYTDVLKSVIVGTEYEDYTVLPFMFTCISRTDKVPVVYVYDPSENLSFKDYTYKGWEELLGEILTYESNNSTVPSYIKEDEPNDIRALLNRN